MEFTKDIKFNNNPTVNDILTISYNGFLCNSAELFIVCGFGENWEYTSEIKMQKIDNKFVVNIEMLNFDTFNFCFRNSNYEWDNNSNCNYITSVAPCIINLEEISNLFNDFKKLAEEIKPVNNFDIDALIQEILEPIIIQEPISDNTPIQIDNTPIDLGTEITNILSQIEYQPELQEISNVSTIDQILSSSVISEYSIESLENSYVENIVSEIEENINKIENYKIENAEEEKIEKEKIITENQLQYFSSLQNDITNIINEIEEKETEKALISIQSENSFTISSRQLSKFYLFKKRIKLALYKTFIKLPQLIFGTDEQ